MNICLVSNMKYMASGHFDIHPRPRRLFSILYGKMMLSSVTLPGKNNRPHPMFHAVTVVIVATLLSLLIPTVFGLQCFVGSCMKSKIDDCDYNHYIKETCSYRSDICMKRTDRKGNVLKFCNSPWHTAAGEGNSFCMDKNHFIYCGCYSDLCNDDDFGKSLVIEKWKKPRRGEGPDMIERRDVGAADPDADSPDVTPNPAKDKNATEAEETDEDDDYSDPRCYDSETLDDDEENKIVIHGIMVDSTDDASDAEPIWKTFIARLIFSAGLIVHVLKRILK